MKKRLIALIFLAMLPDPCLAQSDANMGKVVFYRTGTIRGMVFGCQIFFHGKEIVSLKRSSMFEKSVEEGDYLFSTETDSVNIHVKKGDVSYIECATVPNFTNTQKRLRIVDALQIPKNINEFKKLM